MPSFAFAPARLRVTGGEVAMSPARMSYGATRLVLRGGEVTLGPNLVFSGEATSVRLDRLMRAVPIGGGDGPSMQFQALWQKNCEAVEAAFAAQGGQIDILTNIVKGLQEAQRAAAEANQGVATLNAGISLSSSRTEPVDGLLSASSDGTVSIAAHDRVYTVGSTESRVSVGAGSVGGFAPGSFVRVFYMDAARTGGAVTYQATTAEITQTGDTHVVGGVTVPQTGQPPAEGQGTTPPGYVREPLGLGVQL